MAEIILKSHTYQYLTVPLEGVGLADLHDL